LWTFLCILLAHDRVDPNAAQPAFGAYLAVLSTGTTILSTVLSVKDGYG
jgi:hypothetical protein